MILYVLSPQNKKFSQLFLILAPPKHQAWMGSQPFSIKNIRALSKMWFFLASRISLGNHHLQIEQNHTFIALIPKQLGASSVHQFRSISLCNIIYKIISKILANRFKGLVHHFISLHQSAFIPTRTIQDNTIMAYELFHTVNSKRGRGGLMAIKIDMEKAFDRME